MKSSPRKIVLIAFALCSLVARGFAAESAALPVAISADAGAFGVGGSVWLTVNDSLAASAGYNAFHYSKGFTTSTVAYDGKMTLSNVPVLLTWHPQQDIFHLAAGLVLGSNKMNVTAKPNADGTYTINGNSYTSDQVGLLHGTLKFAHGVMPYGGVGVSMSPASKGLGGFFEVGGALTNRPKTTLKASGPIGTDPTFATDLVTEARNVNGKAKIRNLDPVIRGGLMYRF